MNQVSRHGKTDTAFPWILVIKITLINLILALAPVAQGQPDLNIDSLKKLILNAKEDTILAKNLYSLAWGYQNIGDYEQALLCYDSVNVIAKKFNNARWEADVSISKGIIFIIKSDYESALKSFYYALGIYESIGDKKGLASAYINIGRANRDLGRYKESIDYFSHGRNIVIEINDSIYLSAVYSEFGQVYYKQGNLGEALRNFYIALKIAEEQMESRAMAYLYLNIGAIYDEQEKRDEALENYFSAEKILKELGDIAALSSVYNNIAVVYDLQEKSSEAINYYKTSLDIKQKIGNKKGSASSYNNIGVVYLNEGNYQEAEKNFNAALGLQKEIGSEEGIARVHGNLGLLDYKRSNFQSAREHYEFSFLLSKKIGNKDLLKSNYKGFYKLDSAQGNFAKALENYKFYREYTDSLTGHESKIKVEELKLQYETEKKDQEIDLLNKDNEIKSLQLSKQKAIRHGMIAGIVLLFVTGLLLFRSFRLRKKLEQQQAIINERKRISADLHDDVGSGLSRIMLLTELVKNEAKTPETKKEAEKIVAISKEISSNISEIIWALNANNDTLESLIAYIRRYAAGFFEDSPVNLSVSTPANIPQLPISGERRRDIFYSVKESLHNIYKHSQASKAAIGLSVKDETLTIVIHDNGVGMHEDESGRFGNGLNNIRQRMKAVKGRIDMENHQGTKITLTVPLV